MIILIWLLYYSSQMGFGLASTILGLTASLDSFIGSIILVPFMDNCSNFMSKFTIIIFACCLMMTVSTLATGTDKGTFIIYFFQFLIINTLNVVPYTFLMGTEFVEKVESASERYLMMNFMRLSRQLMTAFFMIAIGALMDRSSNACT